MKEIGIAQKFERKYVINPMTAEETLDAIIEYSETFPASVKLDVKFQQIKDEITKRRSEEKDENTEIIVGSRDAIAEELLPQYLKEHEDNNVLFINPVLKALEFCKTVAMTVMERQFGKDWDKTHDPTFIYQETFEKALSDYVQY